MGKLAIKPESSKYFEFNCEIIAKARRHDFDRRHARLARFANEVGDRAHDKLPDFVIEDVTQHSEEHDPECGAHEAVSEFAEMFGHGHVALLLPQFFYVRACRARFVIVEVLVEWHYGRLIFTC
jgi:hypothetical protein